MNKKFLTFVTGVGGLAPVFAAEADGIDISLATDALTSMKTALTNYWTAAQPILIGVLGIALVVYLVFLGWKLFKRATNKA